MIKSQIFLVSQFQQMTLERAFLDVTAKDHSSQCSLLRVGLNLCVLENICSSNDPKFSLKFQFRSSISIKLWITVSSFFHLNRIFFEHNVMKRIRTKTPRNFQNKQKTGFSQSQRFHLLLFHQFFVTFSVSKVCSDQTMWYSNLFGGGVLKMSQRQTNRLGGQCAPLHSSWI